MLDTIRDPAWQFIGAVLAFLAIAVSLWTYLAQRSKKRLLVETIARIPLVAAGARGIPGLQLRIDDKPLERATVLLIRVQNVGNTPILSADIEEPICIELAEDSVVLSADIGDSSPSHLPARATVSGRAVTIERHLLNPGDMFTCRILIDNFRGRFTARARIAGVAELERRRRSSLRQPIMSVVSLVVALGAVYLSPAPKSVGLADLRVEEVPYALTASLAMAALLVLTTGDLVARIRGIKDRFVVLADDDA